MRILSPRSLLGTLACLAACLVFNHRACATGVPIDGFLPLVGIGLSDEYDAGQIPSFSPIAAEGVGGDLLGTGGQEYFDLALVDTGANGSLITAAANAGFNLAGNGFLDGNRDVTISGATGSMVVKVTDPLGLYATGLKPPNLTSTAPLTLDPDTMAGQTNSSILAMLPQSQLPNVLGLPFTSQYATRILNSQPQIFQHNGQTVRTPYVEFAPRGSGAPGLMSATLFLEPSDSFLAPPNYVYDFSAVLSGEPPQDNVIAHTAMFSGFVTKGALLARVDVSDGSESLDNFKFVVDTGASVSVISRDWAKELGFDVVLDRPEFTIAVVGSGGTRLNVPGFYVDEFKVNVVGGELTAHNVPVLVLNVTDPSDPPNIVDGILGMNMLSGRDVVLDPDISLEGDGPQMYISNPVTIDSQWNSSAPSAPWNSGGSWSQFMAPDVKTIANARRVAGGNQEAVISTSVVAWEVNVSGSAANQQMTVRVPTSGKLTTFSGLNIEQHGRVLLEQGTLDVQYVNVAGGRLTGSGSIATGSGQLPGQVENINGVVAPGGGVGTLAIEGRYSNGFAGALEIELGGVAAGAFDQLAVAGAVVLDGTLSVSLVDLGGGPFVPSVGQSFAIITSTSLAGQFAKVNWAPLPADRMWTIAYSATGVVLKVAIPGDFNGNGVVTSADLAGWKAGYGPSYDGGGFLAWQRSFNGTSGPALGVPEPAAATLAIAAVTAAFTTRRRLSCST